MEAGPKGQYYLRQLWTDPLMTDGKWGLLMMGPGGSRDEKKAINMLLKAEELMATVVGQCDNDVKTTYNNFQQKLSTKRYGIQKFIKLDLRNNP